MRDRISADQAAHLAAELPLLVRGAHYDQYRPAAQPAATRSRDEFIERVAAELVDIHPVAPAEAIRAVFRTISWHMPCGQVERTWRALPVQIHTLWPDGETKAAAE